MSIFGMNRYELITNKELNEVISRMIGDYNELVRENRTHLVLYVGFELMLYLREFRPILCRVFETSGVVIVVDEVFSKYKYEFDHAVDNIDELL